MLSCGRECGAVAEHRKTEEAVQAALQLDPYLTPFAGILGARYPRVYHSIHITLHRYEHLVKVYEDIVKEEGSLDAFSRGYQRFGFNVNSDNCITYREWAPGAQAAYLVGDFSTY